jgi:hypothetical protein
MTAILILGAAAACTNPVGPSQKFMGDPPARIDPVGNQSGFQFNQGPINHP